MTQSSQDPSEQLQRVAESLLSELYAEFGKELALVVLCGSVARKTATANSDIDLCAFTKLNWSQFRLFSRSGRHVDLNIIPLAGYQRERQQRFDYFSNLFREGVVLHDADDWFSRLATTTNKTSRDALPERTLAWCRHRPRRLCSDANDAIDRSRLEAEFVLWGSFWEILNIYYYLSRRDPVKPKNRLADLLANSPECYAAVFKFVSADSPTDKKDALVKLGEIILQKFGGALDRYISAKTFVPEGRSLLEASGHTVAGRGSARRPAMMLATTSLRAASAKNSSEHGRHRA